MKKAKDPTAARIALYDDLEAGRIDMAEAIRRARRIIGMSQTQYAELVGVAPRALMEFERRRGNPTLKTLRRVGAPFGLIPCYRPRSALQWARAEG